MKLLRVWSVASILALSTAPTVGAEPGTAACSLEPTLGLAHVEVDDRSYELYVPTSLANTRERVPLLLMHHAASGNGRIAAAYSGWVGFSERHRFIVAFPNYFTSYLAASDVRFVRHVVADVRSKYCVDGSRIFPTGHSLGAIFANYLACYESDLFASATAFAGWAPGGPDCLRPIAVGLFHGTFDFTIPPQTGEDAARKWAERNRCRDSEDEQLMDGDLTRHFDCDDGVEVMWRQYLVQDHSWPVGLQQQDMLSRMWTFMNKHPLPRKFRDRV